MNTLVCFLIVNNPSMAVEKILQYNIFEKFFNNCIGAELYGQALELLFIHGDCVLVDGVNPITLAFCECSGMEILAHYPMNPIIENISKKFYGENESTLKNALAVKER